MRKFKANIFFIAIIVSVFFILGCNEKDNTGTSSTGTGVKTVDSSVLSDLAKTPPMGWNSWNPFGKNVSEQVIRETADSFVSTGLKDARVYLHCYG
jgi:hypothetical protein